jgi:hypothetical protein
MERAALRSRIAVFRWSSDRIPSAIETPQRDRDSGQQRALPSRRGSAAREQVALLELGRPGLLARVLGEGPLGLTEVLAAEEQAAVASSVPLHGANQQPRVRA